MEIASHFKESLNNFQPAIHMCNLFINCVNKKSLNLYHSFCTNYKLNNKYFNHVVTIIT